MPGLPLMKDFYPGFVVTAFHGVWGPPGMPREIVDAMAAAIVEGSAGSGGDVDVGGQSLVGNVAGPTEPSSGGGGRLVPGLRRPGLGVSLQRIHV